MQEYDGSRRPKRDQDGAGNSLCISQAENHSAIERMDTAAAGTEKVFQAWAKAIMR